MIRSIPIAFVLLLSIVLGGTAAIEHKQLIAARQNSATLALVAGNIAAQRDSTRNVAEMNKEVAELLGDSLRLVEKRVLQVPQRADALDHALSRERRGEYSMNVVVDSLLDAAAAKIDSLDGVGRARFGIRQAPYTVVAQVDVPLKSDSARLALQVRLDTITVGARLTCAAPDAQGVRTASIVASTPVWATVRFGHVEQSPDVCMPPRAERTGWRRVGFKPLSVGVGRAVTWGGSAGWALFVGAVITFG